MKKTSARTVGYTDRNGNIVYYLPYRIERAWYIFRMFLAYLICPELRVSRDRERWNMDYVIQLRKEWNKDVRGRDKAILRLQKRIRELNRAIRVDNEQTYQ